VNTTTKYQHILHIYLPLSLFQSGLFFLDFLSRR